MSSCSIIIKSNEKFRFSISLVSCSFGESLLKIYCYFSIVVKQRNPFIIIRQKPPTHW